MLSGLETLTHFKLNRYTYPVIFFMHHITIIVFGYLHSHKKNLHFPARITHILTNAQTREFIFVKYKKVKKSPACA